VLPGSLADRALAAVSALQSRLQGDLEKSAAHFKAALQLDPLDVAAHGQLGFVLHESGDLAGAAKSFQAALRLDPEDEDALEGLGLILPGSTAEAGGSSLNEGA